MIFFGELKNNFSFSATHSGRKIECEICFKNFSFKSAKDRHVKVVHLQQKIHEDEIENFHDSPKFHQKNVQEDRKNKPRTDGSCKCAICGEILTNKYQKEKHKAQVHWDGKKLTRSCGYCHAEFKFFEHFKSHIESHSEVSICIICGMFFEDVKELSEHAESHKKIESNLKKFFCDHCGHKTFNKIQLTVHMRKHVKDQKFYVCDICGQSYTFIAPFLYHKKLHEEKRDFVCSFCGKGFIRRSDFDSHVRQHTNEKPFKCSICEKGFGHKQVLKNHILTHSTNKVKISCGKCEMKFTDRKYLRAHEEQFHPDVRPFRCEICYSTFKLERTLKIHKNVKHQEDFSNQLMRINEFLM